MKKFTIIVLLLTSVLYAQSNRQEQQLKIIKFAERDCASECNSRSDEEICRTISGLIRERAERLYLAAEKKEQDTTNPDFKSIVHLMDQVCPTEKSRFSRRFQ